MTRATIHQTDFLPWLGFFDRLLNSDILILLDDVQFIRRSWHNRDRIFSPHGSQWLTVPIRSKGRYDQQLKDVLIAEGQDWRGKHLRTLESVYRKADSFEETFHEISEIYQRRHTHLQELNQDLLSFVIRVLDIDIRIEKSSHLESHGSSTKKLVSLCQSVGATTYLAGTGSRNYLEEAEFSTNGIEVEWQKFDHPTYWQHRGAESFISHLSVLDSLFWCGPKKTRCMLLQQNLQDIK